MASRKFPDADKPLPLYFKTTDENAQKEFSYLGRADCRDVVVTAPNAIADSVERLLVAAEGPVPAVYSARGGGS